MKQRVNSKVCITFTKEQSIEFAESLLEEPKNNYEIILNTNSNISFSDNFIFDDKLKRKLLESISINDLLVEDFSNLQLLNNILLDILNGNINIIDTINVIEFNYECSYTAILDYLKKNPILRNKKIILGTLFSLNDVDKINEVALLFKEYPYFKIKLEGNNEPITINEAIKTIEAIDEMANKIKKYNFSPLEQIMYAYDIVRNRVYKEEEENDSWTLSRDLSKVLFGDKIVCLGYAELFNYILRKIGISSGIWRLESFYESDGHARCVVYINDNKYDINGIYFFDPTWDSKKKENDNSYLSSYRYFARTRRDFVKIDKRNMLVDKNFPIHDIIEQYGYIGYMMDQKFDKVPISYAKMINRIAILVGDYDISIPYLSFIYTNYLAKDAKIDKGIIPRLMDYTSFLNRPISSHKLIQVLLNVRKVQYYEDMNKYPFDFQEFKKIALNSVWHIEDKVNSVDDYIKKIDVAMNNVNDLYAIDKQIHQVKLTKTLRRMYDKHR